MTNADLTKIDDVLKDYPAGDAGAVIELLHDLQAALRYLPKEALSRAAEHLQINPSRLFGVATFYDGFHLEPRGEHICTVCMGTACHVRGASRLLEQLERDIGIKAGSTSDDLKFTLEEVNCVGACALGPLVIVDEKYHGNATSASLTKLVKKLKSDEGN